MFVHIMFLNVFFLHVYIAYWTLNCKTIVSFVNTYIALHVAHQTIKQSTNFQTGWIWDEKMECQSVLSDVCNYMYNVNSCKFKDEKKYRKLSKNNPKFNICVRFQNKSTMLSIFLLHEKYENIIIHTIYLSYFITYPFKLYK